MASETELCSLALNQIGLDALTDFDSDDSDRARMCRVFLPVIRDAVLRAYPWNCAKYRLNLGAALADAPATGGDDDWDYQFTLPTNPPYLWVPKQLNEDLEYVIEGKRLLTDESTVTIVYIQQLTDVGAFDSLLSEALVARLASQLAFPLTGIASLTETMWGLYEAKIREARLADAQEGDVKAYTSDELTDVRA